MDTKQVNITRLTNSKWTLNGVSVFRSGQVVFVKLDAMALSIDNSWDSIAKNLPIQIVTIFYQGASDNNKGSYKAKIEPDGTLYLSNRSGGVDAYIDSVITYLAK